MPGSGHSKTWRSCGRWASFEELLLLGQHDEVTAIAVSTYVAIRTETGELAVNVAPVDAERFGDLDRLGRSSPKLRQSPVDVHRTTVIPERQRRKVPDKGWRRHRHARQIIGECSFDELTAA